MNQNELAYQKISDLVTRFDEQFESYKKKVITKPRPAVISLIFFSNDGIKMKLFINFMN